MFVYTQLWDKLDVITQSSKNVYEFSNRLRAMDLSAL